MEQFIHEIRTIRNPIQLEELKKEIKDKVTDMNLKWDERMILYKQVQLINQKLDELQLKKKKHVGLAGTNNDHQHAFSH